MSVFYTILTFNFLLYNMKKRKNNPLWSFDILWYAENFHQVWFWCDYLRFCYKNSIERFDYLLEQIDFDNSNFWVYHVLWFDLSYQKIRASNWIALNFSVSYSWVSIPIFQYLKFNKETSELIWYYWKFDVYSSYFRLLELNYFSRRFVESWLISLTSENPVITRYDFRIDYFNFQRLISVPSPESCLTLSPQSRSTVYRSWWIITDWSVWSKNTWRYLIRLYDKKIDTDKKWKWILFSDYLCFESVHRLEYQFESSFCRGFHLSDLTRLEDKIYTTLWIHDNFDWLTFYSYDSTKEINDYNKGRHIQRFQNQTKKFVEAWYNPFVLMYDTIVKVYGIEDAEDLFTEFLKQYDFKFKSSD